MRTTRKIGIIPICLIAFGATFIGGECLLVFAGGSGGSCCTTQVCGDTSVTHCIDGCSPNQTCTGSGGCDPVPWAEAKCVGP